MNTSPTPSNLNRSALRKRICAGCIAALLCGVSWSARANLIAYDGFNYPLGQTVIGQGTNAGWPSSGQKYTTSSGANGNSTLEASSMSPTYGLLTSGNQLDVNGSAAAGGSAGVYRGLGLTYSTANNIYWFSVLMHLDSGGGSAYAGVSLFNDTTSEQEQLFFGQRNTATTWGLEQHAGHGANSSVSAIGSSAALLVVELNGNTDTASLFVDPTSLGGDAPNTPSATITFTDFSFNTFRIQAGDEDLDVDEMRFGTSYADVTPVPEPGVAWLAVPGLFSILLVTRRQKRACAAQ